jgi:hypothetical protein
MLLKDIIYEDSPFWVTYKDGYYHVYEDTCKGYAEHRLLTDSFDDAKKFIGLQKK